MVGRTEILAHLAEDELTSSTWRYRQMIENPGVQLAGFDQDLWAQVGDYDTWTPADALENVSSVARGKSPHVARSSRRSNGNATARMPNAVGSPCAAWRATWPGTIAITSIRFGEFWGEAEASAPAGLPDDFGVVR